MPAPSLIHLAYIPQRFNIPCDVITNLWDAVTLRHADHLTRQRAVALAAFLLLGAYVVCDLSRRFEELNNQVNILRADLRATRRPVVAPPDDSPVQLRLARDVLQWLGPAVLKPDVRQDAEPHSKTGSDDGSDTGSGGGATGSGLKTGNMRGESRRPHTPHTKEPIAPTPPPPPPPSSSSQPELPSLIGESANEHFFPYIHNNISVCTGDTEVSYVIYVHSSPSNFARRQTMRETWAQSNLFLELTSRVVFFLGATTSSSVQAEVDAEFERHGDVIQVDFHDDIHNSTFKGIAALRWLTDHCAHARYVFKADDDAFVNIFLLVDLLMDVYRDITRLILCLIWDRMPIVHSRGFHRLKWRPDSYFPGQDVYPKHCSGTAYFLSGNIVPEMYAAVRHVQYFWVDDVYVTGLLTQHIPRLEWVQEGRRFRYKMRAFYEHFRSERNGTLMVTVVKEDTEMRAIWALVVKQLTESQLRRVGHKKYEELAKVT